MIETALQFLEFPHLETPLAKPNYRHAKRQKELARKTKQNEKLQRRTTTKDAPADTPGAIETGQAERAASPQGAGERE